MRCFLSYAYKTDISVIKEILNEFNITYVNPTDSLEYGKTIVEGIHRQIKESDFMIAIMDDSPNVAFEIGLGYSIKKPVFLITTGNKDHIFPSTISTITHAFAEPTDYNKIKYNLEIFLNHLPYKKRSNTEIKSRKKFKGSMLTSQDIVSLGDISNIRGAEFERVVEQVFSKLNVDVLARNRNKDKDFQADFSIWIDELDSIVGNPIIVESKSTSNNSSLRQAVYQLTFHLKKYNIKSGLLIYNDPNNNLKLDLFDLSPLIISISLQSLLQRLTEKTLAEIIIELRNHAVHNVNFNG